MKSALFLVGLVMISVSCSKHGSNSPLANRILDESTIYDGLVREFIVFIPDGYTGEVPVPLVFSLHGAGGTKESQFHLSEFGHLARAENFILITPQATGGNFTFWNQTSNPNRADDVGFINYLILEMETRYNIDSERIYIAGSSNGAFMALEIACHLGHKIAAVAAVKGYMTESQISNCNPTTPTAIIQMHGTSDPLVPYENVNPTIQFWKAINQTDSSAIITIRPDSDPDNGNSANSYRYANGINGVEVEHIEIIGGLHDWFGEPGTNYDINASQEAWMFFEKFDINGGR
jgi:polyhydroxybutyrate depolymerase